MVDTQNVDVMETSTNSVGSNEIVYGTTGSIGSGDESRVMSDKVQMLASSIYKEFETMIQKSGEESVKFQNLMTLVVNVLECLDLAYLEKEEYSVDLEMLKEDNEQLMTQYEREKQLRRAQDQKCLEIEDASTEQIRELESKIESLESIMRMLELKAKNASDHAARLEEREADQKNEFDKLHERYNVLLRTHIDHMERTKYLMGSEKFEMMQNMPLPSQQLRTKIGMATSLDAGTIRGVSDLISAHMSQSTTMDVNLANHISSETDWQDEFGQSGAEILQSPRDDNSSIAESPRVEQKSESTPEQPSEPQSTNNVDLNAPPEAEDSLGADLTGAIVDPAEFASAGNRSSWPSLAFSYETFDVVRNANAASSFCCSCYRSCYCYRCRCFCCHCYCYCCCCCWCCRSPSNNYSYCSLHDKLLHHCCYHSHHCYHSRSSFNNPNKTTTSNSHRRRHGNANSTYHHSNNNNNNNNCFILHSARQLLIQRYCGCCFNRCLSCELQQCRKHRQNHYIAYQRGTKAGRRRMRKKRCCKFETINSGFQLILLPKSSLQRLQQQQHKNTHHKVSKWHRTRVVCLKQTSLNSWLSGWIRDRLKSEENWCRFSRLVSMLLGGFLLVFTCHLLGLTL